MAKAHQRGGSRKPKVLAESEVARLVHLAALAEARRCLPDSPTARVETEVSFPLPKPTPAELEAYNRRVMAAPPNPAAREYNTIVGATLAKRQSEDGLLRLMAERAGRGQDFGSLSALAGATAPEPAKPTHTPQLMPDSLLILRAIGASRVTLTREKLCNYNVANGEYTPNHARTIRACVTELLNSGLVEPANKRGGLRITDAGRAFLAV